MQLKIRRSQKSGLTGSVVFVLDVTAELSADEKRLVDRYKLGGQCVYSSAEADAHAEGASQMHNPAMLVSLAQLVADKVMKRILTVKDLVAGQHIECKELSQLLAVEEQIRNAVQAVHESKRRPGMIRVGLERSGDYWEVRVDDNGPGLDEVLAAAIFDPYVTGKRDGTGLGLAIVKKIVVEHGGTVAASHGPMGGARFTIRLPALGSAAARALYEASRAPRPQRKRSRRAPAELS